MKDFIPSSLIQSNYRSYMIRLWQSSEQGAWRASAQCVQTGETILFGDVASLLAFLQTEVREEPGAAKAHASPEADT